MKVVVLNILAFVVVDSVLISDTWFVVCETDASEAELVVVNVEAIKFVEEVVTFCKLGANIILKIVF
jgi:hypothetical protein